MVFAIDLTSGKNEKHGYFFRAHEKYKTKKAKYQEKTNDAKVFIVNDVNYN